MKYMYYTVCALMTVAGLGLLVSGVAKIRHSEPEDNLAPIGVMLENGWAMGCYKDTCVYCKGNVVDDVEVMKTCYESAREKHGR